MREIASLARLVNFSPNRAQSCISARFIVNHPATATISRSISLDWFSGGGWQPRINALDTLANAVVMAGTCPIVAQLDAVLPVESGNA